MALPDSGAVVAPCADSLDAGTSGFWGDSEALVESTGRGLGPTSDMLAWARVGLGSPLMVHRPGGNIEGKWARGEPAPQQVLASVTLLSSPCWPRAGMPPEHEFGDSHATWVRGPALRSGRCLHARPLPRVSGVFRWSLWAASCLLLKRSLGSQPAHSGSSSWCHSRVAASEATLHITWPLLPPAASPAVGEPCYLSV